MGDDVQSSANMLRYWHPVLPSAALRRGSVTAVKIAGTSLALFRTADGALAAVADQCAHRRMKLSGGKVENDRLVCAYHGWSYASDGQGTSPGSPRLRACIDSYECLEASDAIWVRRRNGPAESWSGVTVDGMRFAGVDFSLVRAPLELVIDNFSEVEHTVTMHDDFGFDRARAGEASVALETSADAVSVRSHGPAKVPPLDTRVSGSIRRGDRFHSDFTFRFDPPRSTVRHFWVEPRTERQRPIEYRLVHYFVPVDGATTSIVTFAFLDIRRALFPLVAAPVAWMFRRKLRRTVREDARVVENLADHSTSLEGMKLGRFDTILGATRERLARIYYGV